VSKRKRRDSKKINSLTFLREQQHSCNLTTAAAAAGHEELLLPADVKAALTSLKEEANLLLETKKIGPRCAGQKWIRIWILNSRLY